MKYSSLAACVLFSISSAAGIAADNTYQLIQIGEGNTAEADQSDPGVNGSTIIQLQVGANNEATATQIFLTESSTIVQRQIGSNLSASAQQRGSQLTQPLFSISLAR
ncbi:hypothetical protein [Microbulbifer sp. VAAF005]|uniref:hypothetical protein n=1 Tax=Microbulbifer sp. VAAF005 TaxID=3034230 RepID=UPI0024AD861A|nr:hypothetical protein [Microbulbifer sp. VAAF005]WHI46067.1 hypothetical protein P0078_20470 [Microbulbifer sp. VAAF005]